MKEKGKKIKTKKDSFNREEIIDAAVAKFQDVFMKTGIFETANLLKKQLEPNQDSRKREQAVTKNKGEEFSKKKISKDKFNQSIGELNKLMSRASTSELTIYRNAVDRQISRFSSDDEQGKLKIANSSDEQINISDESNETQPFDNSIIEHFIADVRE